MQRIEKIIEKPIIKKVIVGYETQVKNFYLAKDGTEFISQEECETWENELIEKEMEEYQNNIQIIINTKNLPKISFNEAIDDDLQHTFYKCFSKENLFEIMFYENYGKTYCYRTGKIDYLAQYNTINEDIADFMENKEFPVWVAPCCDDGSDNYNYYLLDLQEIYNEKRHDIDLINSKASLN